MVPAGLSVVSCVQCGRAMGPLPDFAVPPRTTLLSTATLASQLVATIAFALALISFVKFHDHRAAIIALLAASAGCVLAGGAAHRGGVLALVACVAGDGIAAIAGLAHAGWARELAVRPIGWLAASGVRHVDHALTLAGSFAALAAVGCALA